MSYEAPCHTIADFATSLGIRRFSDSNLKAQSTANKMQLSKLAHRYALDYTGGLDMIYDLAQYSGWSIPQFRAVLNYALADSRYRAR